MKLTFQNFTRSVATAALITGVALISSASAQDTSQKPAENSTIEIVDQSGQRVESVEIKTQEANGSGARANAKAGAIVQGGVSGGGRIQAGPNGFTITDADGKQRQIQTQGAQSIVVRRGSKTIVENGEEKNESFGKAIIIGPDGQRQEIELDGPGGFVGGGVFQFPGLKGAVRANRVAGKFMIGVNCAPVSELLASQMRLEPGTGLAVQSVAKDSPAAKAGVEKHDILMFVEDKQLATNADLNKLVETAGNDKTKVSITLIRAGKEQGVDINPVERPANAMGRSIFVAGPGGLPAGINDMGEFDLQIRQVLPGLIMEPQLGQPGLSIEFHQQMKADMERMDKEMEELRKRMNDRFKGDK